VADVATADPASEAMRGTAGRIATVARPVADAATPNLASEAMRAVADPPVATPVADTATADPASEVMVARRVADGATADPASEIMVARRVADAATADLASEATAAHEADAATADLASEAMATWRVVDATRVDPASEATVAQRVVDATRVDPASEAMVAQRVADAAATNASRALVHAMTALARAAWVPCALAARRRVAAIAVRLAIRVGAATPAMDERSFVVACWVRQGPMERRAGAASIARWVCHVRKRASAAAPIGAQSAVAPAGTTIAPRAVPAELAVRATHWVIGAEERRAVSAPRSLGLRGHSGRPVLGRRGPPAPRVGMSALRARDLAALVLVGNADPSLLGGTGLLA
jgi:hypothetical protein